MSGYTQASQRHDNSLPLSSSSLYVTFKVAQLVNNFRKRVKTRVFSNKPKKETPRKIRDELCYAFEKEAFQEIDRYLGRKRVHPNDKHHSRYKAKTLDTLLEDSDKPLNDCDGASRSAHCLESLLQQFDNQIKAKDHSLFALASQDKLFVKQGPNVDINHFTARELALLVSRAEVLLASITRAFRYCFGNGKLLCSGKEISSRVLDETFLANLEHLLLCLRSQVLVLLVSRGWNDIQRHVAEWQKEQSRHSQEWFFEFPDARHPLSTTWPWSIKPSLAVLWGVCWMFYSHTDTDYTLDSEGNLIEVDEHGRLVRRILSREDVLAGDSVPDMSFFDIAHAAEIEAQPQPQSRGRSLGSALTGNVASQLPNAQYHNSSDDHASSPLDARHTNATRPASAAPQTSYVESWSSFGGESHPDFVPEDTTALGAPAYDYAYGPAGYNDHFEQSVWQQQQQQGNHVRTHSLAPPAILLPQRTRATSTPAIKIDTRNLTHPIQVPSNIYSSGSQASFAANNLYSPHNPSPANLSPMQTPISAHSGYSEMTDSSPRPRAPSDASSIKSNSGSPRDERSPPNHHGEPPITPGGKIYCNYDPSSCANKFFERKCEWTKHMDKHTRPYRCKHSQCSKLQGFTYSGGLLRHEREVHKKYGGPKDQLVCPMTTCKRHSGHGFTRKENLNEHLRRVHKVDSNVQPLNPAQLPTTTTRAGSIDDEDVAETPGSGLGSPLGKRKRSTGTSGFSPINGFPADEDTDKEDLRAEIKRLRQEANDRDEKLEKMEKTLAALMNQRA